ncbi:N-acetylmuramidase domain-containing protein [Chelativorans alearense]|uniref:N-acetylmuramidase domain-containing protein n=1 Tax=Chelativorans alearense TaxID=2681495 RepID=UPI0013D45EEE|nr:N-acetylmuramidase domain-containing protein [Chelativorans alearense]
MLSADTIERIIDTASRAGLEPALILAVVEVETGGRTHAVVNGRREPLIRFEGHYFDRRLSPPDRELARREGLAAPSAGAVHNPPGQAARWRMLERAVEIDRRAAYESTSWGMGQVMGAHWAWLGFENVDALVDRARSGLEGELDLMLRYIGKAGLLEPLGRRDWAAFARGYNGPAFARNSYHVKLSLAYRRHARRLAEAGAPLGLLRRGDRGMAVRHLQNLLRALGHAVAADGDFGPRTGAAVRLFQRRQGLAADGIVGPATMAAMEKALPPAGADRALQEGIAALWRRIAKP